MSGSTECDYVSSGSTKCVDLFKKTSKHNTETMRCLNARLSWILPTSNAPRRQAAHNSAPQGDHHKFGIDSVAASSLQSWLCAIRLSDLWSLKKPKRTQISQWRGTAERSAPAAAEEETLLPGGNTCSCLEMEDRRQNMETTAKNNYDFQQCCGEVPWNFHTSIL